MAKKTKKTPEESAGDKRHRQWLARIDESIEFVRKLVPEWRTNVDYRRGKQFATADDCDRIAIPFDWSATKAKHAQMFSQVPETRLTPKHKQYAQGTPIFAKKLNDVITRARVGTAMDECLPDVINASGLAGVIVAYESRGEDVDIPMQDPMLAQMGALPAQAPPEAQGAPPMPGAPPAAPPMQTVPYQQNGRYTVTRLSPADLLFPKQFIGSDFDDAPWQGRRGRTTWSDAKVRFRLKDEDRDKVVGQDTRQDDDRLSIDDDTKHSESDPMVEYREIYYWRYLYHPDELSYEAIHHMVYVSGLEAPSIDEEWKGQKRSGPATIVGSCKPPIRYLTLTYLSDEVAPPSDSAIGRPQVDELIRLRSLSLRQVETSLPTRWMNTNLVDPLVQANLLRGTWQTWIPLNGTGDKAIGEVARASYPNDNKYTDEQAKGDLTEAWQISSNQMATRSGPAIRSAAEANIVQQNFQTRVGYERARVVNFFVGIAEVLAGLICIVRDFDEEEQQALAQWPLDSLSNYYFYNVRADASVLLDSTQRLERLSSFLNLTAKSGYVNVKPIIEEMALLSGLNPADVVIDPQPPQAEQANLSLRGDTMSLQDPMVVAWLKKNGQAPSIEEIEEAKKLILAAGSPPAPPPPPPGMGGMPQPGAPGGEAPPPQIPTEDAMPDWNTASRVEKRAEDGK